MKTLLWLPSACGQSESPYSGLRDPTIPHSHPTLPHSHPSQAMPVSPFQCCLPSPLFFFNVSLFLRERERETKCEWGWGRGRRERETQNSKWAPGSKLSAQSPMQDLNSQTVRSCHDLSQSQTRYRLRHPGAPSLTSLK